MANSQAWKYEEREIAKKFGTQRMLKKGSREKSDIDDPIFAVDCKLQKRWDIPKWFSELQKFARKNGKVPILICRHPSKKKRIAVMDADNLISILKGKDLISGGE